jgi:hypothetical protein
MREAIRLYPAMLPSDTSTFRGGPSCPSPYPSP